MFVYDWVCIHVFSTKQMTARQSAVRVYKVVLHFNVHMALRGRVFIVPVQVVNVNRNAVKVHGRVPSFNAHVVLFAQTSIEPALVLTAKKSVVESENHAMVYLALEERLTTLVEHVFLEHVNQLVVTYLLHLARSTIAPQHLDNCMASTRALP